MKQLFLDCDGVLADFDTYAEKLFGMPPREYEEKFGQHAFWKIIAEHPDFYANLPLMPGARSLCLSKDKRNHMQSGDFLVDDWPRYQPLWEAAGGIFVLHTSAASTIFSLREYGVID